jgi:heme exporter protein D
VGRKVDLGPHAAFIVAAYAVASAVVLLLIIWVLADYRAQLRLLTELEKTGASRRSETRRPVP